jgi:hypothetical protein
MKRAIGAGCAALAAIAVAGGAEAGALKCAKPQEVTAIQAAAIQQELMVAALTCNDVPSFNAFQTSFNHELRVSDDTLLRMFHRLYGFKRGEAEYHAFKTRLANDSSMRSIHDNPDYCKEASMVFSAALTPQKPALADFVAGVQVSDNSPIDSCEIRVATGLKGAAIPTVVPRPNPVRVAQLTADSNIPPPPPDADSPPPPPDANAPPADLSAPASPAPPASPDQAAAPEPGVLPPEGATDAPPPAQTNTVPPDTASNQPPAKKDSSGWLSDLTDLF